MSRASAAQISTSDFDSLVCNGIDFLKMAMSQLDNDPKHSVINFYTAVELFLKAPLVHEHWSLVVADRDPNRQKYEAGDFLSVTFEDACRRLSVSLNKQLKPSTIEAFNKVREHRNRIVHFYHDGIDGEQRDEIKLEQAQAWFELNRFIADTWREKFMPFLQEFRNMEQNLIANNHYAQAKYKSLKPRIDGLKCGGKIFQACPNCRTDGCQVEDEGNRIATLNCLVCFLNTKIVQIKCPNCNDENQYIRAYEEFVCTKCQHKVSGEKAIFDILDQNHFRGTKDDFESNNPASCDECQGYETVCDFEQGYLCTSCFQYFDSVNFCEWCYGAMTGSSDGTYFNGCEHCDGHSGHHADD